MGRPSNKINNVLFLSKYLEILDLISKGYNTYEELERLGYDKDTIRLIYFKLLKDYKIIQQNFKNQFNIVEVYINYYVLNRLLLQHIILKLEGNDKIKGIGKTKGIEKELQKLKIKNPNLDLNYMKTYYGKYYRKTKNGSHLEAFRETLDDREWYTKFNSNRRELTLENVYMMFLDRFVKKFYAWIKLIKEDPETNKVFEEWLIFYDLSIEKIKEASIEYYNIHDEELIYGDKFE